MSVFESSIKTNYWVFGSLFLNHHYLVFDQSQNNELRMAIGRSNVSREVQLYKSALSTDIKVAIWIGSIVIILQTIYLVCEIYRKREYEQ